MKGDKEELHGQVPAYTDPYLPGSVPQNPAPPLQPYYQPVMANPQGNNLATCLYVLRSEKSLSWPHFDLHISGSILLDDKISLIRAYHFWFFLKVSWIRAFTRSVFIKPVSPRAAHPINWNFHYQGWTNLFEGPYLGYLWRGTLLRDSIRARGSNHSPANSH